LYGVANFGPGPGNLFTINTSTAQPTLIGDTGVDNPFAGLAYDTDHNVLYMNVGSANNGGNELYRVNTTTGVATLVGPNGPVAGLGIEGLAFMVPEPASLSLLGIAVIAGLMRRRFVRESTRPGGQRRVTSLCALAVVGSVSLVASVQAAPVSVGNAGFESPADAEGAFGVVDVWTTSTSGITNGAQFGAYNPGAADYPGGTAPEGLNVGWIYNVYAPSEEPYNMEQTLSAVLTAGTRYTLTVEVGNPLTYPGNNPYQVQLLAGSTVLAMDDNSLTIPKGTFQTSTVTYDATAGDPQLGQALTIRLVNLPDANASEVDFDNVRLNATAIPEPAALATLPLLAAASLSRRSRRR
jgi:hypothetical protein